MNKSFVRQLLQRVETHEVYMHTWMEGEDGYIHFDDLLRDSPAIHECGTTACCAGHACLVDIEKTKQVVDELIADGFANIGWEDVAKRLMDIPGREAGNLFYSFWPDEYLEMGDKAGLVAILKRGLEEGSFEFVQEKW